MVEEAGEEDVGEGHSIPMTDVTSAESEDIMHMTAQDLVVAVQEVVVVGHPDIPGKEFSQSTKKQVLCLFFLLTITLLYTSVLVDSELLYHNYMYT